MKAVQKTRASLHSLLWLCLEGLTLYIAIKVALYV